MEKLSRRHRFEATAGKLHERIVSIHVHAKYRMYSYFIMFNSSAFFMHGVAFRAHIYMRLEMPKSSHSRKSTNLHIDTEVSEPAISRSM